MKFLKKLLLPFVFAGFMALGTTSANAACKVHLGDFDWDSANVHTAIASYILEKGYGCEVQATKGSTTPIMAALFDQQIILLFQDSSYHQQILNHTCQQLVYRHRILE